MKPEYNYGLHILYGIYGLYIIIYQAHLSELLIVMFKISMCQCTELSCIASKNTRGTDSMNAYSIWGLGLLTQMAQVHPDSSIWTLYTDIKQVGRSRGG